MNNKEGKPNKLIIYLLIGAAVVFTLYALFPKYPGHVILPLVKAFLLAAVIFIYGFFLMTCFKSKNEKIEFPTAFAFGLMFTTLYFYLVSIFKILVPGVIILFYLVPVLLLFIILKRLRGAVVESVQTFFKRSPLEYPAFFLPFIYASLPSSFYDSLVYHLGIPNLYLQYSGFVEMPQFLFANTSIFYEISLIPAVFAGDMVPRLFHFLIGVIFLLAAADFAVETFGIKKRYVLILLLLSMPMSIFLLSTVKNDLVSAFFILLGARFLLKKQYLFSALFWGFSIGIKYFNAIPLVIFLVIFFVKEKQFPIKKVVVFGLVVGCVVMPLLVKNYIFTHNPFFPFLSGSFKTGYWDASRQALMQSDVGKMYYSPVDLLKLPYTVSFNTMGFGGTVGAQFLIFLPFLLVLRKPLKGKWHLLVFSLVTLFLGGYFTKSMRFVYIVFVCLSFYLAVVYESRGQKIIKTLFSLVIAINFVIGLAHQERMFRAYQLLMGKHDIEVYKASVFPSYPAFAYVNRHAGPDSGVMLVGEARNYYLKLPYRVSSGIDYSILKKYLNQSQNVDTFVTALKDDGIDYIIFNLNEFNRLQGQYHRLDESEWRKWASYLKHLQSKVVFHQKGVFVFKLANKN
ncbi:MAG: hypothetical protein GTO45_18600 [Candidatus Aminicenantes bacterium]|nr:hypothetical protein [Candidatus Aminicenantes bacterium]NIM80799.1 hypothetical protein [Candidatus Aminicenantes bacterium]NIN20182.1 hypothetical protein [Candidatus Aminicenantes bacterium]NIN43961.1 hypothetical protein [Candidatus Aminicenantes bacterium]NIN86770.1 hypothetical protein [Candidatus Aminicenantes bacterium]